jgi:glycosyltransferase involved in cell wall biosynthesis
VPLSYNYVIHGKSFGLLGRVKERTRSFIPSVNAKTEFIKHSLMDLDVIHVIKLDLYKEVSKILFRDRLIIVHVMSFASQYGHDPFEDVNTSGVCFSFMSVAEKERFVSSNKDGAPGLEERCIVVPLFIDNDRYENMYSPSFERPSIGIFSRISYDQPTLFALFLVHMLRSRGVDVKLMFYGAHYDEWIMSLYRMTTKNLRIEDLVSFRGHTFSIGESIRDDALVMGVMNSIGDSVGYSSIELLSYGLPILFFNSDDLNCRSSTTHGPNLFFNRLDDLVHHVLTLLSSPDRLALLSVAQREYVKRHFRGHEEIEKVINLYGNA